jgi:hypothetical protein
VGIRRITARSWGVGTAKSYGKPALASKVRPTLSGL